VAVPGVRSLTAYHTSVNNAAWDGDLVLHQAVNDDNDDTGDTNTRPPYPTIQHSNPPPSSLPLCRYFKTQGLNEITPLTIPTPMQCSTKYKPSSTNTRINSPIRTNRTSYTHSSVMTCWILWEPRDGTTMSHANTNPDSWTVFETSYRNHPMTFPKSYPAGGMFPANHGENSHSPAWLKLHGQCLDGIYSNTSTMEHADGVRLPRGISRRGD